MTFLILGSLGLHLAVEGRTGEQSAGRKVRTVDLGDQREVEARVLLLL